jgi:hypothetical protein
LVRPEFDGPVAGQLNHSETKDRTAFVRKFVMVETMTLPLGGAFSFWRLEFNQYFAADGATA